MTIDYNDRRFRAASNSINGEVGSETRFHYHQKGDIVWGEYGDGEIVFGTLIAKVLSDGSLDMRYQHVNSKGTLMTGFARQSLKYCPTDGSDYMKAGVGPAAMKVQANRS